MSEEKESKRIDDLCDRAIQSYKIDPAAYNRYEVKRGLRNLDGSGVLAGLTQISEVHGYTISEDEKAPAPGELSYRGYDINDLAQNCGRDKRFGFEEVCYLLLEGRLPTPDEFHHFCKFLAEHRELPELFTEDMILKQPSRDIMNKLARSVLTLYSYDDNPDDCSVQNILRQSISLIARLPVIAAYAYRAKRHYYDGSSLILHTAKADYSIAENLLRMLRSDRQFTKEEAEILDLALILHAEHGGGNNSTFACRVLSSSGTDTYAAIAAAICALKGPRHGGANAKVMQMMAGLEQAVSNWEDEGQVYDYLAKIVKKEAGDGSGLIYGMGHAVYTMSDPRTLLLKEKARALCAERGLEDELRLYELVERLAPDVFHTVKGDSKVISANIDFYSGFVYKMLGIPQEMYTPLFAIARTAGWCAHRIEEVVSGGRIIRPAYKSICKRGKAFIPPEER